MINTLLVDECEAFRLSLRRMLASKFRYMRLGEAATMSQAVARAHTMGADLVFVEVRLPDGNGLDLARVIAPGLPQARVCVMTSFDLPEYRAAARESGACHYLAKSDATSAQVVAVVRGALSHRAPVVILDDDAARVARLQRVLAKHWPVILPFAAGGAHAAVDMALACRPELVVAWGPLLQGDGTMAALRAASPGARIVAFCDGSPGQLALALDTGADHAFAWKRPILASMAPVMQSLLSRRPPAPRCSPGP